PRGALMTESTCPNDCKSGVVACWSPGGPCDRPNEPGCETCGTCNNCTPARVTLTDDELLEVAPLFGLCSFIEDIGDASMCQCGGPALTHDAMVLQLVRRSHGDQVERLTGWLAARDAARESALRA